MRGLHCIMQDLSLQHMDFIVVAHVLSFSAACGILVPRLRIELASSAFQGRFLIIGPPGKPRILLFLIPINDFISIMT